MDSFWESDSNKRKLMDCAYEYYLEHPMKAELTIVCSGYLIPKKDTSENRPAKSSAECFSSRDLATITSTGDRSRYEEEPSTLNIIHLLC